VLKKSEEYGEFGEIEEFGDFGDIEDFVNGNE